MWWERDILLSFRVKTKGFNFGREAINTRDENLITRNSEALDAPFGFGNDVAPVGCISSSYIDPYNPEIGGTEVRISQQFTSNKEWDETAVNAAEQKLW